MQFSFDVFTPGQRVKFIDKYNSEIEYGETGTVVPHHYYMETGRVAVDWDKAKPIRHNCAGTARNNHGWCVWEQEIEIIC